MDLPVWFVYRHIMKFVTDAAAKNDKWAEYKDDLIGKDIVVQAPERYYDVGLVLDLHIPLTEWDDYEQYSLRDKAEIRAQRYLQNMVDVVERHYRMMDDNERKRRAGTNNSNGST